MCLLSREVPGQSWDLDGLQRLRPRSAVLSVSPPSCFTPGTLGQHLWQELSGSSARTPLGSLLPRSPSLRDPTRHTLCPPLALSLWAVRVSSYGQFWCLSLSVALCLPLYSVHCKWLLHRSLQLILFSVRPRPPASTKSSSSIFF